MAGLTGNRNISEDAGGRFVYPLADNVIVSLGSMVVLDAQGNANPGVSATGLKCVGVAALGYQAQPGNSSFGPLTPGNFIDNTRIGHAAGAMSVECRRGIFRFNNSSGDPVVAGDIGEPCFIVDDHTVSHGDGVGTQSVAGRVEEIDAAGGIWVNFDRQSALAS